MTAWDLISVSLDDPVTHMPLGGVLHGFVRVTPEMKSEAPTKQNEGDLRLSRRVRGCHFALFHRYFHKVAIV
jgi:hypothetical protein